MAKKIRGSVKRPLVLKPTNTIAPHSFFPRLLMVCAFFWGNENFVGTCAAQTGDNFQVSLNVDFSSAETMMEYFDWHTSNTRRLLESRGNAMAEETSLLLARIARPDNDFEQQLALARSGSLPGQDMYGLLPITRNKEKLRALLAEAKRRQLDRRIMATLEAYFPNTVSLSATIQVYIVLFGNEKAAAVVRRVRWNGNMPVFTGDESGEPVILLNLARIVEAAPDIQNQFLELLATLAHESFHAVFAVLQKSLPDSCHARSAVEYLFDIVQNEGIAYYLSFEIHQTGRPIPQAWFRETSSAVDELNRAALELELPSVTPMRARELLMNANLSGSFKGNYGATAGLRMAYEIDTKLGRQALAGTLAGGFRTFLSTYLLTSRQNADLPQIDARVSQSLNLEQQKK